MTLILKFFSSPFFYGVHRFFHDKLHKTFTIILNYLIEFITFECPLIAGMKWLSSFCLITTGLAFSSVVSLKLKKVFITDVPKVAYQLAFSGEAAPTVESMPNNRIELSILPEIFVGCRPK
jgi:hypothetical protein